MSTKLLCPIASLAILSLAILGCGGSGSYLSQKNTAISTLHQIAVVADPALQQSNLLDSVDYCYGSAYPLLPRPEPYFDLRLFSPEQLLAERTRRELKAYLILSTLDSTQIAARWMYEDLGREYLEENPSGVHIVKNKWAQDQILVYIYAPSEEKLIEKVKKTFPTVQKKIEDFYAPQAKNKGYLSGVHHGLTQQVEDKLSLKVEIPRGYQLAMEQDDFMWLRMDKEKGIDNLLFHTYPYTHTDQLSKKGIKEKLNDLGRKYISSSAEGSYLRINDEDLPVIFAEKRIDGNYAIQVEGIWEMENDFMGGPYVAYFVVDEEKNRIILLEGLLFAPGEKKRNSMIIQKLILQNAKINP